MKLKSLCLTTILTLLFLTSCRELWGVHGLGAHFALIEGDKTADRIVIYCADPECNGGLYVVPSYKRHYIEGKYAEYAETAKANEDWIIVKTIEIKSNKKNYWIIKQFDLEHVRCGKIEGGVDCDSIAQSHVIGPLNSSDFDKKTTELKINLHFLS